VEDGIPRQGRTGCLGLPGLSHCDLDVEGRPGELGGLGVGWESMPGGGAGDDVGMGYSGSC